MKTQEQYNELLQAFKDIRSQLVDSRKFTKDSFLIKAMDLQIETSSK